MVLNKIRYNLNVVVSHWNVLLSAPSLKSNLFSLIEFVKKRCIRSVIQIALFLSHSKLRYSVLWTIFFRKLTHTFVNHVFNDLEKKNENRKLVHFFMNLYLSFSSLDKVYLYVHLEKHFVFSVSKVNSV